jgi:hypothetical protein
MNLVTRISSRTRRVLAVAAIGLSALAMNAGAASASTPITVYGVCHLSSLYGTVYTGNVNGEASAWWLNSAGSPYIVAFSTDGNSSVDAAGVTNSAGEVAWVASCNQRTWTSAARIEQQQQRGVANLGYTRLLDENASDLGGINPIGADYGDAPLGDY